MHRVESTMRVMKPTVVLAFILGTLTTLAPLSSAHAQNRRRESLNVLTTNPLSLIIGGTINVEYERAIAPFMSVFAGPQLQFGYGIGSGTSNDKIFGLDLPRELGFT
jgi:hypothetical protein